MNAINEKKFALSLVYYKFEKIMLMFGSIRVIKYI